MVVKKGLPTCQKRWCCAVIKENGGKGRFTVTGNRRSESKKRSSQADIDRSHKGHLTYIRPIANFTEHDVWQYIHENNVAYCSLYDEGFKRLGCVLCPFNHDVEHDERYFPKIVKLWKRACDRIVERAKASNYINRKGKPMGRKWTSGDELYQWWTKRR